jgi:GNAT superfamily N-acetyltransferase
MGTVLGVDGIIHLLMTETNAITVREVRIEDLSALAELATQLGYPSSQAEMVSRLGEISGDDDHAVFVAEVDGQVAGWVHVFIYRLIVLDHTAEVGGLVVDSARRGSGVGRALMQQAEAWAREHSCQTLYLRSNVIRTEAHKFYEALGYQRIKSQYAFDKQL